MIEEIKNEISPKIWHRDNKDGRFYNCTKVGDDRTKIIKIDDLFSILDKYNNLIDKRNYFAEELRKTNDKMIEKTSYELAWEELTDKLFGYDFIFDIVCEIEQKYNLGGE